jgi:hypothetical protein
MTKDDVMTQDKSQRYVIFSLLMKYFLLRLDSYCTITMTNSQGRARIHPLHPTNNQQTAATILQAPATHPNSHVNALSPTTRDEGQSTGAMEQGSRCNASRTILINILFGTTYIYTVATSLKLVIEGPVN